MALPKKLRFEILKRDEFRCRYCGRGEGDGAKLHVDHVIPKALGGQNDPANLATACADCNLGKSARMLSDPRIIGIDFAEQKKIFDSAEESLQRYREYIAAKDEWEHKLVSELLRPLQRVFAAVRSDWDFQSHLAAFRCVWIGPKIQPSLDTEHIPPEWKTEENRAALRRVIAESRITMKHSVLYFFKHLGPEGVRDAAQTTLAAFLAGRIEPEAGFRYFCGICHRSIGSQTPGGSPS